MWATVGWLVLALVVCGVLSIHGLGGLLAVVLAAAASLLLMTLLSVPRHCRWG